MNKKTRVITLTAMFSALSVIYLYFAALWPTGRFGFVAFSSLFAAAAVCDGGVLPGLYVYVITSALGFLLIPDKSAPLLYVLFFGFYPVVKSLIERLKSSPGQWILKLLVFNLSLTVIWFFLRATIFDFGDNAPAAWLIYFGCNIVFLIFDYGYSKLIGFYIGNISKHLRGGRPGNR